MIREYIRYSDLKYLHCYRNCNLSYHAEAYKLNGRLNQYRDFVAGVVEQASKSMLRVSYQVKR